MPYISIDVAAGFAAQVVGATIMAVVLSAFQHRYRTSYLQHWTFAWIAMAVYHACALISLFLAGHLHLPATNPGRVAAAVTMGLTGYVQIGWFAFGTYELVRRRPVRIVVANRVIAALAAVGVGMSLLAIDATVVSNDRYLARTGVRALITAVVFSVCAVWLWRARRRTLGAGVTLLSLAMGAYALEQCQYAALATWWWVRDGALPTYVTSLGLLDFLLQSVMGLGMIATLLEDEREAADLATDEVAHLAYHDPLTGLPNRPLFIDRLIVALAQAHRSDQRVGVFFLDLDRFKDINESLGHSSGDQILKAVAERIAACVREGDTVARFGGDEFTLLVPRIENVEDAAKIAEKVIETLKLPLLVAGRELFVTTSIGVSLYPNDGGDAETLLRNADTAMYRAKDCGRDNYQLYAPEMNARALERLALENMLRKALVQDELVLHYQPLVDARNGRILGVEALVRWQHPELGLLAPAGFIGVAEISGLIIPMGDWVLRTACRQILQWQKTVHSDLYVAVNLSARQFQQPDLLDSIRAAIRDTGISPSSLELEITESNAMQNAENTIFILRELKSIGVRIAIDDFGTGYSSLNYLKRFPIDTLKLDQTFVRDVTTDASDAAIVSAVISMAHSLDLHVVAEGVETAEQLAFLQKQRCDRIQGYFFSAPMHPVDIEPYLFERGAEVG